MAELERVVGANVRRLRMERGLTQEALAHEAGITTRYVGVVEKGEKSATIGVLGKLATVFGVEPGALFERH